MTSFFKDFTISVEPCLIRNKIAFFVSKTKKRACKDALKNDQSILLNRILTNLMIIIHPL